MKTYDINIDNAGGQGSAKFTIVYGTSTVVGYAAPTRTGYTFAGYFTAASDGVKIINADGTLANATGYVTDGKWSKASDTVLFAQWQANTYGMSLDKNGGAVNGHVTATYGSSVLTNLEDATRYGYGVSGYYTAAEGGVVIIVDGKLQKDTAYTDADGNWDVDDYAILYAHWEPNQYTVTLNSNNGYADGLTKIAYETSEFLWFTHASGNTGYHLDGYFTQAEGGSMVISVAQLLQSNVDNFTDENGKWIKAEDCTLYAHWSPNVDGIILHSNGGTEHGHASVKYDGTSPYLTTHATRTGYSVEGYYTAPELEVKVMNADGTFVPNVEGFTDEQGRWHVQGDQTFYAKWTANIYDVGLLSALATLNGTAKATYGETSVNITMPPEYAYHHPEAYYTTSDLDVKVINADGTLVPNVPNFTDSEGRWIMASNTDVYVKWAGDLKHLVITYSYSDGSGQAFPSVDTYVAVGDSYSYDSPALEGYTPDIATVSGTIEYFDVTEWVRYAPNDYTITFVTNGGSDIDPYTAPYKSQIPEKETHRLGYDFAGWFSDESLQTPYELTTMPLGGITIYAKWTFTVYTIDYALGGGQNDPANPATFTMDTDTITLRPATRTGYTFGGWFADMGYTQQVTQIPKGTTLEYGQTLYFVFAKWTVNQYTITFDTQGGSPVASITKDYMAPVQTPANPTKDGYTFGGWMRDGSRFQVPPEMPAENIDLVALWVKVETSGSSVKVSVDAETVVIDTAIEAVAAMMNDATKTEVSVTGNGWAMDIPMEVVMGATGPVSAGAKPLSDNDVASLPAEVQSLLQGKTVYTLSLTDSNGAISFTGKAIKVSLPYKLQDGEKASNVKVFYIDENNKAVEVDAEYDEQAQCAVFSTDHFSTWYVDATSSGSGGGSNVGLIVGIIVGVLLVAAVVAVVVLVKTGKIGGAKGSA